jgi:hypothetical protein
MEYVSNHQIPWMWILCLETLDTESPQTFEVLQFRSKCYSVNSSGWIWIFSEIVYNQIDSAILVISVSEVFLMNSFSSMDITYNYMCSILMS